MSTVRFHCGTAEVIGKVAILDRKALEPGESGLVQLRLDEPVVIAAGDRFVLRLHSPMITVGGGSILDAREQTGRLSRVRRQVKGRLAAPGIAGQSVQPEETVRIHHDMTGGVLTGFQCAQPRFAPRVAAEAGAYHQNVSLLEPRAQARLVGGVHHHHLGGTGDNRSCVLGAGCDGDHTGSAAQRCFGGHGHGSGHTGIAADDQHMPPGMFVGVGRQLIQAVRLPAQQARGALVRGCGE